MTLVNGKQRRVTLLLNLQIGYCRRIVTGVAAHAERKGWLLEEMPAIPGVRERLKRSQPDGVIAHILDEPLAEMLQNLECPVVSVSSNLPERLSPRLMSIIARLAEWLRNIFWIWGIASLLFSGVRRLVFQWRGKKLLWGRWVIGDLSLRGIMQSMCCDRHMTNTPGLQKIGRGVGLSHCQSRWQFFAPMTSMRVF